ncbi:hypothetical protein NDA14_007748 [Ustilago hordei]|nr:hypothetical protein NDA14_007748 [Ustilago hordei]
MLLSSLFHVVVVVAGSMVVVQSPWRPWTPMDSHAKGEPSHMRGGPGTATRRTKLKEQAQPRRGPSSDGYHSGARETRVIGHWQAGPEEEEQCRGSRHQVMRRRSRVDTTQEAQGCQAGEAPEQYSMKKVLSGERAGAALLAML